MIIQIRGTSGSGKSTVMRDVMDGLGTWRPEYISGRKKPLYYIHRFDDGRKAAVLGHYLSPCGGCDNVGSARAVFELIHVVRHTHPGCLILSEGLLLSEDVKWSSQLPDLRAVFLTTPLDRCLRQIEQRRREAGNDKPLNPANTSNRVAVIERARVKLMGLGVSCYRVSPEKAPKLIFNWIERDFRR